MEIDVLDVQSYALCEADFCRHYQQHYAEYGGSYAQYRPVYRYGYDLGVHKHYGGGTWTHIESEARTLWETRNPGTWEQFKDPIRYAWERATGKGGYK